MSEIARRRVMSHSRQKGSSLLCLSLLAEQGQDSGEGIFVKDPTRFVDNLAHQIRMTPKRTRDILSALIESGELRCLEHETGKMEYQIVFPKTRYTTQTAKTERQKRAINTQQHGKNAPARSGKRFPQNQEKISGKDFLETPEKISPRENQKNQSGTMEISSTEVFSSINMNINNKNNTLVGREGEQATNPPTALPVQKPEQPERPAELAPMPTHDTRLKFFEKLMGFQKAHHYFHHLERWDEQYSREFISLAWRLAPAHKHPRFAHRNPEFLFVDWLNRHKDCSWPEPLQSQYEQDLKTALPELHKAPISTPSPTAEFVVGQTYLHLGQAVKLEEVSPTTPWATVSRNGEFFDLPKTKLPELLQQYGGA